MGELDPFFEPLSNVAEGIEFLREKEEQWLENRGLYHALDLLSAAHVLGSSKIAKEAAEFVLAKSSMVSDLASNLATQLLGLGPSAKTVEQNLSSREHSGQAIRALRQRRIEEPRNAFVWCEMARLYVILGMPKQAEMPMNVALALAPFDRLVLRSAARFYLHTERPDKALALLRGAGRTAFDPWLIASEIAISSVVEKGAKFARRATKMIAEREASAFHMSEMAAALASTEMWNGHDKDARKLFGVAIEHPAENALAQRVWASRDLGLGEIAANKINTLNAFEAKALAAKDEQKWTDVVKYSRQWALNESFSARPYGFGSSVISSLLGDGRSGEKFAREGLLTNPNHPGLINNIAFSLIVAGDPKAAKVEWLKADTKNADVNSKLCLLATAGLIEYRLGNGDAGRRCYEQALAYSGTIGDKLGKATAQLYYAREERASGQKGYEKMFDAAIAEIKKIKEPYSMAVAARIAKEMGRSF
jgi:tetratricopeptide (TPR) repeat protein